MIDGRAKAKSDSVSIRLLPLNVKDEKKKANGRAIITEISALKKA